MIYLPANSSSMVNPNVFPSPSASCRCVRRSFMFISFSFISIIMVINWNEYHFRMYSEWWSNCIPSGGVNVFRLVDWLYSEWRSNYIPTGGPVVVLLVFMVIFRVVFPDSFPVGIPSGGLMVFPVGIPHGFHHIPMFKRYWVYIYHKEIY